MLTVLLRVCVCAPRAFSDTHCVCFIRFDYFLFIPFLCVMRHTQASERHIANNGKKYDKGIKTN